MVRRRRTKKADEELQLWQSWKQAPSDATLTPVLDSLQPVIQRKAREFSTAPVPPGAVLGAANELALRAINTYDPNRGASLRTHVDWNLRKVRSFVVKHQNLGKIPDQRAYGIGRFKAVEDELTEKLGYPPDAQTMAEALGPKWSVAEVRRMRSEDRPDLIASLNLEPDLLPEMESSAEREVLRYIWQDLTPDERTVFEYSIGANGKPKMRAGQIAAMMGISQPKVSRIRRKIDRKLQERGV